MGNGLKVLVKICKFTLCYRELPGVRLQWVNSKNQRGDNLATTLSVHWDIYHFIPRTFLFHTNFITFQWLIFAKVFWPHALCHSNFFFFITENSNSFTANRGPCFNFCNHVVAVWLPHRHLSQLPLRHFLTLCHITKMIEKRC